MLTSYTGTALLATHALHLLRTSEFPPLHSATLPPSSGPLFQFLSWPSRQSVMWSQYQLCLKTALPLINSEQWGNWVSNLNNNVLLLPIVNNEFRPICPSCATYREPQWWGTDTRCQHIYTVWLLCCSGPYFDIIYRTVCTYSVCCAEECQSA